MEAIAQRDDAMRRVERELARLDGLIARARLKRRVFRTLRGGLGAAATLLMLLKTKIAASLGLKLVIAGVVGLGLAWPMAVLVVVVVAGFVATLLAALMGEGGPSGSDLDGSWDCGCKRERMKRLKHLIALRRAWLAAPTGRRRASAAIPVVASSRTSGEPETRLLDSSRVWWLAYNAQENLSSSDPVETAACLPGSPISPRSAFRASRSRRRRRRWASRG